MLLLLPPSERKAPARAGAPLDLASLSHPELTGAREQVLTALAGASAGPGALELLGVGQALAGEVARNTAWRTEPAQRVSRLFTGVLFDALDLPHLPRGAAARSGEQVRVVSAVFGLLSPTDRVPAHRASMDADLPGTGPLAAHWRPHLSAVLDARLAGDPAELVVDCRSAAYAAAWRPARAVADRVVAVRVLREVDGRRSVVSHSAKHTRGLVARHLLTRRRRDPRTPAELAAALGEAFEVELAVPTRGPATVDVVTRG